MSCIWPAEKLAAALGGKPSGSGWVAKCPAHDDQTESLTIWAGEGGRTAYDCKATCPWGEVTLLLEKAIPDAFSAKQSPAKETRATIIAEYDYFEMTGPLVGQVVRFDPKGFRQRKPKPGGGWAWKMEGLQLPLYRLREIATAKALFIVEGEKDVQALESLGLPATCNPGGAGKWRNHHTAAMAGKRLCIIADNDPPKGAHNRQAGWEHAVQVATAVYGVAESIRIILAPSPHKDVSDWIAGGATRETITDAARETALWEPGPTSPTMETTAPTAEISDNEPPPPTAGADANGNWFAGLLVNEKDAPRPVLANAMHALRYAPALANIVRFDDFRGRIVVARETPWGSKPGALWGDADDALFAEWLQRAEIRVGEQTANTAATTVAQELVYDSLQDYLRGLKWDGVNRLHLMARIFGNTDELIADVMKRFMISAVARAMKPGCQADHVIVLEGAQRKRKSTSLRILFDPLGEGWFRDDMEDLRSKDSKEQLRGAWAIEIAELQAISTRRIELEHVKAFLTRRVDSYRPPYARRTIDVPRRNVFAGTTNDDDYLRDHTGNRRFWPVPCSDIDISRLEAERHQLWAETYAAFECGEEWWYERDPEDLVQSQADRVSKDPWYEIIEQYTLGQEIITIDEILQHLKIDAAKRDQTGANRAARVMRIMGWDRKQFRDGARRYWAYIRGDGVKTTYQPGLVPSVTSYDA